MKIHDWLIEQNIYPVKIIEYPGYTSKTFRVEQIENTNWPVTFFIKCPKIDQKENISPLGQHFERVFRYYQAAAEIGISPAVLRYDIEQRILCLADAGERRQIRPSDMSDIVKTVEKLQSIKLLWSAILPKPTGNNLDWSMLDSLFANAEIIHFSTELKVLAQKYQLEKLSLVPSHSDLNPANWLHNGKQWQLIDWDFAGYRPALWDWAGMIVSHHWKKPEVEQGFARIYLRHRELLPWFCACLSLVSWDWYECYFEGTPSAESNNAAQQFYYWWDIIHQ